MAIKEQTNPTVRGILVLLAISVVCVALLSILNDLLYVPPDTRNFSYAAEGIYNAEIEIKEDVVDVKLGEVAVVAEGQLTDGTDVVGLYVMPAVVGKAYQFEIVIVIELNTNTIVGYKIVENGSNSGFEYSEETLEVLKGTVIPLDCTFDYSSIIQAGATVNSNSSKSVYNAFVIAAQYYNAVYRVGTAV